RNQAVDVRNGQTGVGEGVEARLRRKALGRHAGAPAEARPTDANDRRLVPDAAVHASLRIAAGGKRARMVYCAFRPVALAADCHFSKSWRMSSVTLAGDPANSS